MKRFREDLQLAPIVAQFVPFHLDTRKQEWQAWARKHPHDGNGIPIVYVVRADGETLYAKTGAPQGDDLPRLLVAQLTRSGKAITPTQSTWFNAQADALASALEQEDEGAALEVLESVSRKVDPTQIGSFAESAVRMQSLAKTVVDGFRAELDLQQQRWSELDDQDQEGWLASARELANVNQRFRGARLFRSELSSQIAGFKKNVLGREFYPAAEILVAAEALGGDSKKREEEVRKLRRLITRHQDSPVVAQASELLQAWGEPLEMKGSEGQSAAPEFREWTDKTGKFKVVALLVELDGDEVVLRRKDLDKEIRVPMSQLSSTDRRYLKDLEK